MIKKQFRFTIEVNGKPRGIMVMAINYADAIAQLKMMHPTARIIESY